MPYLDQALLLITIANIALHACAVPSRDDKSQSKASKENEDGVKKYEVDEHAI